MSTLLLRLAAPMQSWGISSKFDIRDTERQPSKSGVIGLLACALGIRRDDKSSLNELTDLRFGVRVDREGKLMHDFHMARGEDSYVTHRYYLCDAIFLVGLSCDDTERLNRYAYALSHPVWPLFLGRRSCPPTLPLVLGVREKDLETALREEPLLDKQSKEFIRMVTDSNDGAPVLDVPVSFSSLRREFSYRKQKEDHIKTDDKSAVQTLHDAFGEAVNANVSDKN